MLPRAKEGSITAGMKARNSAGASGIRHVYNQLCLGSPAGQLPQLEYTGLFPDTNISSKVIFQSKLILKTNTKMARVFHATL